MNESDPDSVPLILTLSSLYPNEQQPQHGIFVEQRLRQLLASGRTGARVLAPVPWFPLTSKCFGDYARYASIPLDEERHRIKIVHPRFLTLPKIGMHVAPWLMAKSIERKLQEILEGQIRYDLIDAHYFYPDGIAAAILAKKFKIPLVITARGTDINLIPKYKLPRKMILWAADQAAAIVAVSRALKERMIELGVEEDKITVLRNGVDLKIFKPIDQKTARLNLGAWRGRWLLSVGHLIERKGHHLIIEALCSLPDTNLAVVGDGPMYAELHTLAARLGVSDRVRILGAVNQSELPNYYSAADALVLASSREGMANVLLEAIACGLPVVATPIWGTPEVIAVPEAGVLTQGRSSRALVNGINDLFGHYPDRRNTRKYAEGFSWTNTTNGLIEIFRSVRAGN